MQTIQVKPRELTKSERKRIPGAADRTHVRCVDPERLSELPPEGAKVPKSAYWMTRLRDGDVVRAKPPTTPKASGKSGAKKRPQSEG